MRDGFPETEEDLREPHHTVFVLRPCSIRYVVNVCHGYVSLLELFNH